MTKPEIIQETPITMADVKEELDKIKKKSEKINFRAEKTDEYLHQFTQLSLAKAKELREKIDKLKVPRLKEEHITKVIDLLPGSAEEVKSILQGYTITVTAENLKKIAEVTKEFK